MKRATKRRFVACIVMLAMLCGSTTANAQWTKLVEDVYSPSFGEDRRVLICLPPTYDPERAEKYATYYGLHSGIPDSDCEDHDGFSAIGYEAPIIVSLSGTVISSAASIVSWNNLGFPWVNSDLIGPYEDYVFDIIAHIDSTYNTYGTGDKRAVRGSSITASGSVRMGLKYPDAFAALITDNGYPDLGSIYDPNALGPPTYTMSFVEAVRSENAGPPYAFTPNGFTSAFAFRLASALTPNLSHPPYYVDFFLNEDGTVNETVRATWMDGHGTSYARRLPPGTDVKIWVDYELNDPVAADMFSLAFLDSLDAYGMPYQSMTHDCGHGSPCTDRQAVLEARSRFIAEALNQPVTTTVDSAPEPAEVVQVENYPNPFSEKTLIQCTLRESAEVQLTVYDMLGRKVAVLHDGRMPPGTSTVSFDRGSLAPGVYIYQLSSTHVRLSRPMFIVE